MKTKIVVNEDPLLDSICVKKAESEYDRKMLIQIVDNINFLNENFPQFKQELKYCKQNEIGLRASPGICLFSERAFD